MLEVELEISEMESRVSYRTYHLQLSLRTLLQGS